MITFFKNEHLSTKQATVITNTDNPLLIIAYQLISLFKEEQVDALLQQGLFDSLLAHHSKLYPSHLPSYTKHYSAKDRVTSMLGKPGLILALSHTLRHLAVENMLKSPASYVSILVSQEAVADLRKKKAPVTQAMLHALTRPEGLNLGITLSEKQDGKLPHKHFFATSAQTSFLLHLQKNNGYFTLPKPITVSKSAIAVNDNLTEINSKELQSAISQQRIKDEKKYFNAYRKLQSQIEAGKLNFHDLCEIYIKQVVSSTFDDERQTHLENLFQSPRLLAIADNQADLPCYSEENISYLVHALSMSAAMERIKLEEHLKLEAENTPLRLT